MYSVKLEQFEGPLDLLLEIIEQEKLDISLVSLASVTEGYVKQLEANPNIPLDELVDFLVVASKLLFIKSRILLPFLGLAGEEEGENLEGQLRIYKEYLDASKVINSMIGKRRFLFVHERLPKIEIGFAPPEKFYVTDMRGLLEAVIKRLEILVHVPRATLEKSVSIHEKITEIREMLGRVRSSSFRSVLMTARNRTEVVVTFLALLELVKQRAVEVRQSSQFQDITITSADEARVQQATPALA